MSTMAFFNCLVKSICILLGFLFCFSCAAFLANKHLEDKLPTLEYEALEEFYNNTNGPNWSWAKPYSSYGYPWNFSAEGSNPCSANRPWQGVYCDNNCQTEECHVVDLDLSSHRLKGTIPPSIRQLNYLHGLSLDFNYLSGTIPPEIGQLDMLEILNLYENYFTGSLPQELGELQYLRQLNIFENKFTGSLPSTIGKLHNLYVFQAGGNHFSQTLPAELGLLKDIYRLSLGENAFTGQLPSTLGSLKDLHDLYLDSNEFTGPLLLELGEIDNLVVLWMSSNGFTGSFPTQYANLYNLDDLHLDTNFLTGNISVLGQLISLKELYLSFNIFTGPIFGNIGHLFGLEILDLAFNAFSGPLPVDWSWSPPGYLILSSNKFSGTIPSALVFCFISILDLSDNKLTGTIPENICQFYGIAALSLSDNLLTGTIPACTGEEDLFWGSLGVLYLQNNSFSGKFLEMPIEGAQLIAIDLSLNKLSGTISPLWMTDAPELQAIHLNNNALSGTIDGSILTKPSLRSLSLSSNCFSGTLPQEICSATTLEQLLLDGLHSSSTCISKGIPFLKGSGVVLKNPVHGTIPSCLFNLSSMKNLHLGGNAFHGTIPDLPHNLSELILASNALTGLIPSSIWHQNLSYLDLSLNRLQGTILKSTVMAKNSTVILNVNQLSGTIPDILQNLPIDHVNILDGNMFSCSTDRSDLPSHDPNVDSYNCGSDATNNGLVAFGTIACIICLTIVVNRQLSKLLLLWLQQYHRNIEVQVEMVLQSLQQSLAGITAWCTLLGMILFGILSIQYSSYTESAIWKVSGIYKIGLLPTTLILIWFFLVSLLTSSQVKPFRNLDITQSEDYIEKHADGICSRSWWLDVLLITANVVVVIVSNGFYVYAVTANWSAAMLTVISYSLAIFKMAWNYLLMSASRKWVHISTKIMIGVSLFNNLVAPFLAELFVSPDCFYYIVTKGPDLIFHYPTMFCQHPCDMYLRMVSFQQINLSIVSSFHYSYQCSFSLISSYIHVFIIRYAFSGMLIPFVMWGLRSLRVLPNLMNHTLITMLMHPLWKPLDGDFLPDTLQRLQLSLRNNSFRQGFVANFIADVSMIICFGSIFPPLAVVIALAVWSDIINVRLALGRFQETMITIDDEQLRIKMKTILASMEDQFIMAKDEIYGGIWYGLCVSAVIWSFVLFDTLAQPINALSIAVVCVMVFVPYVMFIIIQPMKYLLGYVDYRGRFLNEKQWKFRAILKDEDKF